jgi:anthranilate synthase component 1
MHNSLNLKWINKKPHSVAVDYHIDFYDLYRAIRPNFDHSYLFESLALPKQQDRFYTAGFDPVVVFEARGKSLIITGRAHYIEKITGQHTDHIIINHENPYQLLQESMPMDCFSKTHQGGLVGYFSHEAVNYFEPSLALPEHPDFGAFCVGLYLDGLVYDTTTGQLDYYYYDEDRTAQIKNFVEIAKHTPPALPDLKSVTFNGHSSDATDFKNAVADTIEKIKGGFSFQAEVGFKSLYTIEGDKITIYNRLRDVNPSPYMYYLKFGDRELMGASPEILISNVANIVLTTPAAGTIKRGETPIQDIDFARTLLNDPKEISEHNMLVDLHRNDLSRVCMAGTVTVSDLHYIMKFSHVQHIVSSITGIKRPDKDAFDVLAAILPGGVTSGAPKIETLKIIADNEKAPRGPYGGGVGRISFNGDGVFCIPIRSLFCKGDAAFAQTCAGIVYDSIPEKEYQEVLNKLAAMQQVLNDLKHKSENGGV